MKKQFLYAIVILCCGCVIAGCASSGVKRIKDISFDKKNHLKLDVYASEKITEPKKVLVFVHGGRWKTGKKSQYKFLGNRFARKGVVTVIVDYRLSPRTDYRGMAADVANAVEWVQQNIISYGGNDQEIFLAGHSAGGHLAALVSVDKRYFDSLKIANPIKGTILIDAFGLDMYKFLSNESFKKNPVYYDVFTKDSVAWKDGSPSYHLSKSMPPSLLFVGGKTYPVITESTKEYQASLAPYYHETKIITVKKKKHIPMILQFYNADNKAYKEILEFMNSLR